MQYKASRPRCEFPDGSKQKFTFPQLEETYNEIRNERTKLSLELGDVLKPVTAAKAKMDGYISDHMVDLTPQQIDGLKKKRDGLGSGNRADQRGGGQYRRSLRVVPHECARAAQGHGCLDDARKARRSRTNTPTRSSSHPEPELLQIHDPEKFGCSPCHQGNGRATTSVEKAHGNYEHWLWPLYPKENSQAGCQTCHAADMVLASGDVQC